MNRTRNFFAKKALGQHFLKDHHAIQRMIDAIPGNRRVLEIGPGSGALTYGLLSKSMQLTVVEKDDHLADFWQEQALADKKLSVVHGDVMRVLDQVISKFKPHWVVGNLPYNISGPLTAGLAGFPPFEGMVLMYQYEVAERIRAESGSRVYGGLSVLTRHHYRVLRLFRLPPGAFRPPPKVHSSVLLFQPHGAIPECAYGMLQQTVRHGFMHRRKTISNNFRTLIGREQWKDLGIAPGDRPEALDYPDWVRISMMMNRNNIPPTDCS